MADKLNPTQEQIADYLIDTIISEMTQFLIDDYGYTLEKSLDIIYTSKTLSILSKPESGLYIQSSSYNYELLIKEKGLYPIFELSKQNERVAETEVQYPAH